MLVTVFIVIGVNYANRITFYKRWHETLYCSNYNEMDAAMHFSPQVQGLACQRCFKIDC